MNGKRKFWIAVMAIVMAIVMWVSALYFWISDFGELYTVLVIIASGVFGIIGLYFGANFGEHWTVMKSAIEKKMEKKE